MRFLLLSLLLVSKVGLSAAALETPIGQMSRGEKVVFDMYHEGVKNCNKGHAEGQAEHKCKELAALPGGAKVAITLHNFLEKSGITGFPGGSNWCRYEVRVLCEIVYVPTAQDLFVGTWLGQENGIIMEVIINANKTFSYHSRPANKHHKKKHSELNGKNGNINEQGFGGGRHFLDFFFDGEKYGKSKIIMRPKNAVMETEWWADEGQIVNVYLDKVK